MFINLTFIEFIVHTAICIIVFDCCVTLMKQFAMMSHATDD